MKKLKLHGEFEPKISVDGYHLNPTEKYIINIEDELKFQNAIAMSFAIIGPPPALKNYHQWLLQNGFNPDMPNPTNEFVEPYYGVNSLWKTAYSQGIVVKAEHDIDFYIVMECSNKNRGYKHTKVILTPGGCI